MTIDDKKYRQLMAALTALIDLFPDETERKLKEKKEAEKIVQNKSSVAKMKTARPELPVEVSPTITGM